MRRFFYALIALCAFVVVLPSCGNPTKRLITKVEPATFVVYTYDEYGSPVGSGSGFFIEKSGVGVTNFHVLDQSVKAAIKTTDGSLYEIDSVLCSSSKKDVLVFRVKNDKRAEFKTVKITNKTPEKGNQIYCIGAPMGMESSLSEGIISSYRDDNKYGKVAQITAAISNGSSGSPILDSDGKVFAIAAFKRRGGENLNFGVVLNEDFQNELDKKEFYKKNRKFNSEKSDFILLNVMPERGSELILNAIEFGKTSTSLYFTYTNMHLNSSGEYYLWCELNEKDNGLYMEDVDSGKKYYVTSSTLASTKKDSEAISLAGIKQFKVDLPVIKNKPSSINVVWDDWTFSDINLDNYRESLTIDELSYKRSYALLCTSIASDPSTTIEMLTEVLDENPEDAISLNMMAIFSYIIDNKTDAMYYLEEAIETNPNDELAYLNRAEMYSFDKNYKEAIKDVTTAINLVPDDPDNYITRAHYYYINEEYQKALDDVNTCLSKSSDGDGFKNDPLLYEFRAYIYYALNNRSAARADVQKSYRLSRDKQLDRRLEQFYSIL